MTTLTESDAPQGILLVDKPGGLSSHAVVAKVRKALGTRKVGHAGTLDPAATGLLVIGIGRATRLLGYLTKDDKSYESVLRFGQATTTDDAESEVVTTTTCSGVLDADVVRALHGQRGRIQQKPSAVSAVKVDGKRAYDRVRSGEDVDLPAREVVIHSLEVTEIDRDVESNMIDAHIQVRCSSGTYIRAIARDAGEMLGVGGHVVSLRRTAAGDFSVTEALPLSDIAASSEYARMSLVSMYEAATRSLPWAEVTAADADAVRHGRRIPWPDSSDERSSTPVALVHDGELLALAECSVDRARYLAVFA